MLLRTLTVAAALFSLIYSAGCARHKTETVDKKQKPAIECREDSYMDGSYKQRIDAFNKLAGRYVTGGACSMYGSPEEKENCLPRTLDAMKNILRCTSKDKNLEKIASPKVLQLWRVAAKRILEEEINSFAGRINGKDDDVLYDEMENASRIKDVALVLDFPNRSSLEKKYGKILFNVALNDYVRKNLHNNWDWKDALDRLNQLMIFAKKFNLSEEKAFGDFEKEIKPYAELDLRSFIIGLKPISTYDLEQINNKLERTRFEHWQGYGLLDYLNKTFEEITPTMTFKCFKEKLPEIENPDSNRELEESLDDVLEECKMEPNFEVENIPDFCNETSKCQNITYNNEYEKSIGKQLVDLIPKSNLAYATEMLTALSKKFDIKGYAENGKNYQQLLYVAGVIKKLDSLETKIKEGKIGMQEIRRQYVQGESNIGNWFYCCAGEIKENRSPIHTELNEIREFAKVIGMELPKKYDDLLALDNKLLAQEAMQQLNDNPCDDDGTYAVRYFASKANDSPLLAEARKLARNAPHQCLNNSLRDAENNLANVKNIDAMRELSWAKDFAHEHGMGLPGKYWSLRKELYRRCMTEGVDSTKQWFTIVDNEIWPCGL